MNLKNWSSCSLFLLFPVEDETCLAPLGLVESSPAAAEDALLVDVAHSSSPRTDLGAVAVPCEAVLLPHLARKAATHPLVLTHLGPFLQS